MNPGRADVERSPTAGFSMVEVIIAIVILAIGVLGLAGTTAYIVRNVTLSDLMTERSAAFQTVVDQLQSLPFDSVGSGTDSIGVFAVRWTSTLDGPQNKVVTIITVGPGLARSPVPSNDPQQADTFEFRVLRR
jgi:prepilin-type N-terminal cleavage/methylation domain-containing protein